METVPQFISCPGLFSTYKPSCLSCFKAACLPVAFDQSLSSTIVWSSLWLFSACSTLESIKPIQLNFGGYNLTVIFLLSYQQLYLLDFACDYLLLIPSSCMTDLRFAFGTLASWAPRSAVGRRLARDPKSSLSVVQFYFSQADTPSASAQSA